MRNETLSGSDQIAVLINTIMQPAMAGGMSEEHAKMIYDEIMSSISSLGEDATGKTAFDTLIDDIIFKLMPYFQQSSISIDDETIH